MTLVDPQTLLGLTTSIDDWLELNPCRCHAICTCEQEGPMDPQDLADRQDLIDRVTARTKGTHGDPLTREEVAQVVEATLKELGDELPEVLDEPVEDGDDTEVADGEADPPAA